MRSHYRLTAVALSLTMLLQSCVRWTPQSAPLADVLAHGHVKRIRVTRQDGTRIVLSHPFIDGTQVTGFNTASHGEAPFSMPLADVRSVSVGQVSPVRTTLLVVGVASALLLALGAWAAGQIDFSGPGPCTFSCQY